MTPIDLPLPMRIPARIILTTSILGLLTFAACERKTTTVVMDLPANPVVQTTPVPEPAAKTTTVETRRLSAAIDTFEKVPTEENKSSVKLAFAKLDGEIAELEDRVVKTDGTDRAEASAKLNNLQRYRDTESLRFTKDLDGLALDATPPVDSRSAAQKAGDTAEMVGEKVENGGRKVERTLEKAARNTGEAIKDATH